MCVCWVVDSPFLFSFPALLTHATLRAVLVHIVPSGYTSRHRLRRIAVLMLTLVFNKYSHSMFAKFRIFLYVLWICYDFVILLMLNKRRYCILCV